MQAKIFTLQGAKYEVLPHPPSELGGFALRLAALASGPVVTLITAQKGLMSGKMGDMDLANVSATEVQAALVTIAEKVTQDEIRRLFMYVTRNGKALGDDLNYDQAYQGNWVEWYSALFHILKSNGFFDFLSSLSEAK